MAGRSLRIAGTLALLTALACASGRASDPLARAAAGALPARMPFVMAQVDPGGGAVDELVTVLRSARGSGIPLAVASEDPDRTREALRLALQRFEPGSLDGVRVILVGRPDDLPPVLEAAAPTGALVRLALQP